MAKTAAMPFAFVGETNGLGIFEVSRVSTATIANLQHHTKRGESGLTIGVIEMEGVLTGHDEGRQSIGAPAQTQIGGSSSIDIQRNDRRVVRQLALNLANGPERIMGQNRYSRFGLQAQVGCTVPFRGK